MKKEIVYLPVMKPAYKWVRRGMTIPAEESAYIAHVMPGEYITIIHTGKGRVGQMPTAQTFRIGDLAEYDSYNFSYYGEIIAISPKTVTIQSPYGSARKKLSLYKFCWRNYDFNAADAEARNRIESMNH